MLKLIVQQGYITTCLQSGRIASVWVAAINRYGWPPSIGTGGRHASEFAIELSPVLKAMGLSLETGKGAIRFSLGRSTTKDEIDHVLKQLDSIIRG